MEWKTWLGAAIFALIFSGSAGAVTDLLVDQNGVVTSCGTLVDNPQTAGIASAAAPPTTPAPARAGAAAGKLDPAVPQVELYVTSWCPYCKKAEEFFRSQGIPFTAYDIEKDNAAARRKEELDSSSGVPLAIINGQKIHGFSERLYREALEKRP